MADTVVLVAASGLAREVISALEAGSGSGDLKVLGLVDDDVSKHGTDVGGYPVLGGLDEVRQHPGALVLVCAGRGAARRRLVERLQADGVAPDRFARVIDPSVRIPASCSVGAGSILLAGTILTADVTLGRHVVVMPEAILTHDDDIADFATLCAGVTLGGSVRVEQDAYLGMGAMVRECLTVGSGSVLGMGSVLLRDLPHGETWAGVPARPLGGGR